MDVDEVGAPREGLDDLEFLEVLLFDLLRFELDHLDSVDHVGVTHVGGLVDLGRFAFSQHVEGERVLVLLAGLLVDEG